MKRGMTLQLGIVALMAVIPLSAQTQDQSTAPKPKAKHVYTDADFRPLDEKCADPSVPAEDKVSCPKSPTLAKGKDGAADAAKAPDKNAPKYDENGDLIPQEPDLKAMGTDGLNQRIRDMQVQQDRAQESINTWSKRLADAKDDKEKKMYQDLVDGAKQQFKDYSEKRKAAEARLAEVSKQ